jgi:hypothetical protein
MVRGFLRPSFFINKFIENKRKKMSRITGSDALGLMEAYAAVYAPQEITEEQVWEEVEAWVNSLVEEGYDLSEYTWEDMYEEYLNEAPIRYSTGPTAADLQRQRAQASTRPAQNLRGLTVGPGGFNINGRPVQSGMSPIFQRPGQPAPTRPTAAPAPAARPSTSAPTRSEPLWGGGGSPSRPAPASRPSTSAPTRSEPLWGGGGSPSRPAAAPARPSTSAPTRSEPLWGGGGSPSRPAAAPARPSISSSVSDLQAMRAASLMRQQNRSLPGVAIPTGSDIQSLQAKARASAPQSLGSVPVQNRTTTAFSPSMGNLAARPTATAPVMASRSTTPARRPVTPTRAPILQRAHFDPFDIVMGHLIDEGYAENEEAAAVIMANMSVEWRDEIVEEILDEANKAEKMLGLTSRERSRARNLNQYTDKPIFYKRTKRGRGDNSDPLLNKAHKEMSAKRQASHKAGRHLRGDTGESGNVVKSRYQANKNHENGYPSIRRVDT